MRKLARNFRCGGCKARPCNGANLAAAGNFFIYSLIVCDLAMYVDHGDSKQSVPDRCPASTSISSQAARRTPSESGS